MAKRITENQLFVFLFAASIVLYLTYSESVASLYFFMLVGTFIILRLIDKKPTILYERKVNTLKTVMLGLAGAYGFLFLFSIVSKMGSAFGLFNITGITSVGSVIEVFAESLPLFAGNVWVAIFTIGIVAATIETWLVAVILELFKDKFLKVQQITKITAEVILFLILIGIIAVIYHIKAKGITTTATGALVAVFIFFIIMAVLIIMEKGQWAGANLSHVMNNVTAMMVITGVIAASSSLGLIMPVIIGGIYYIFREGLNIRRI